MGIFIGRFGWDLLHHCASGYHQGAVVICSLFVWGSLGDAVEGYWCVFIWKSLFWRHGNGLIWKVTPLCLLLAILNFFYVRFHRSIIEEFHRSKIEEFHRSTTYIKKRERRFGCSIKIFICLLGKSMYTYCILEVFLQIKAIQYLSKRF